MEEAKEAVRAAIGPSLERLSTTFPSQQAYLDFWQQHPALAGDWNDYIERSLIYDLAGSAPELASTVSAEAVLQDAVDHGNRVEVERALGQVTCPVILVRAPLGLFNEEPPLYPDPAVAAGRRLAPQLADVLVPSVNHYTIGLSRHGAGAVADVIRERSLMRPTSSPM